MQSLVSFNNFIGNEKYSCKKSLLDRKSNFSSQDTCLDTAFLAVIASTVIEDAPPTAGAVAIDAHCSPIVSLVLTGNCDWKISTRIFIISSTSVIIYWNKLYDKEELLKLYVHKYICL